MNANEAWDAIMKTTKVKTGTELEDVECRSCGSDKLRAVLDLGKTPLANSLLSEEQLKESEPKFPLLLAFCEGCSLVQITHSVPPEDLFREYIYYSSFSDTMLTHAHGLVEQMISEESLTQKSFVVEAASNDGYLLKNYVAKDIPVLGVEPARNIAKAANDAGVRTVDEFFDDDYAKKIVEEHGQADVFHANNVLAHVPDLNGFVAGIRTLLKPKGVAVVEVPQVKEMLRNLCFDTIYHEHLSYFSLYALKTLFYRHDLELTHVEELDIHGGSLRIYARPVEDAKRKGSVFQLLETERKLGVDQFASYENFAERVEVLGEELNNVLEKYKSQGAKIAAYGAAAKGSTLMNYFDIDKRLVSFVVDRSTHKHGSFMPGTHQPIHPTKHLMREQPDLVLLLSWNFKDEILRQQTDFRARGGKFVVPIPKVEIV